MTNIINSWNGYCGCTEKVSECNTVIQKVDEVPSLGDATRNHVYLLPDNTAWIVNNDGTGFSQLNSSGAGGAYDDTELRELIQQALDRNTMEDNRLVNIENKNATQDERLTALENRPAGGEAYDDTELRGQVSAMSALLDSKLTLTSDNMSSTEAGLGDIYEVDFSNLETKLENNKLTISNPIGKVASRAFTSDENPGDGAVLILERISKELFRATVEITATNSGLMITSENIDDLLLQIIPEGVSEIDDMLVGGGPLDLVQDTAAIDNIFIQSVKANGGTGNNSLEVQFFSKLGRFTYSAIFKTGVE